MPLHAGRFSLFSDLKKHKHKPDELGHPVSRTTFDAPFSVIEFGLSSDKMSN
jgi:hypothetical protein